MGGRCGLGLPAPLDLSITQAGPCTPGSVLLPPHPSLPHIPAPHTLTHHVCHVPQPAGPRPLALLPPACLCSWPSGPLPQGIPSPPSLCSPSLPDNVAPAHLAPVHPGLPPAPWPLTRLSWMASSCLSSTSSFSRFLTIRCQGSIVGCSGQSEKPRLLPVSPVPALRQPARPSVA